MHRTNIYLDTRQVVALDRRASSRGISRAAALREVLDDALGTSDASLERDLEAIRGAAGAWADDRPSAARTSERDAHLERLRNL